MESNPLSIDSLIELLKALPLKDLVKAQVEMLKEMQKRAAAAGKATKKSTTSKAKAAEVEAVDEDGNPIPAGPKSAPVQLRKNFAWVGHVLEDALENGWPEFPWNKDKDSWVLMPAGEQDEEGAWVFQGLPAPRNVFTRAHAMSLAAHLKTADPEKYEEWCENVYEPSDEEKAMPKTEKKPAKPVENKRAEMSFEDYVATVEKKVEEEQAKEQRKAEREAKKAAAPKAKAAAAYIANLTARPNVLIVLDRSDLVSYLSLRNLQGVHVLPVDQLNAYDVLLADDIVFTKSALDAFIAGPAKGVSVKAVASSAEAN